MNETRQNLMGDAAVAESLDQMYRFSEGGRRIGEEEIRKAWDTLQKYRQGKANLEQKIIQNEEWYRLRHWESLRSGAKEQIEPTSAWLFNAIANKHADAMDNLPTANVLPREEGDREEAKRLSSVLPVIMKQCRFESVYSKVMNDKIKNGTGVYGVFWDPGKLNGLGDVSIERIDLLNLFWQPGAEDIQKSRNLFYAYLRDNEELEDRYPQLKGQLGGKTMDLAMYFHDDNIDINEKSLMVDWYYKRLTPEGKTVLHYCQFVSGWPKPLFASENEPDYGNGWYEDGEYPFVFDVLFPMNGTPCGFGYIDIGKAAQEYIDRTDQAILTNLFANARPRYLFNQAGGVNEEEFSDLTKPIVHVSGVLNEQNYAAIQSTGLNSIYVTILNNKIEELKETSGNRDVSNGGTTGGATAAAAIAAMMEASSKLSRDSNKGSFESFERMTLKVIERVRQSYKAPRYFRITGEDGQMDFVAFDNSGLAPQPQGEMVGGVPTEMGVEVGYRLPLFDLDVTAEKASAYSRLAQNEMALQFYNAGFFIPQNSDAALACLDMMDIERKDGIMQKIRMNGTLFERMMAAQQTALKLASMLDPTGRTAQSLAAEFAGAGAPAPTGAARMPTGEAGESGITKRAKEQAAQATAPT